MKNKVLTSRMLSENPVQRETIKDALHYFQGRYDDVYDVANHIAALQKIILHLKESTDYLFSPGELDIAIAHAMQDWKTTNLNFKE